MLISETLTKMNLNSSKINKLLKSVSNEVSELSATFSRMQQVNTQQRIEELKKENDNLEKQIEKYKGDLAKLRTANGAPEIHVPKKDNVAACSVKPPSEKPSAPVVAPKSEVKAAAPKKENKKAAPPTEAEEEIHFGRLDIRVGKIISVEKHPNADALYVEQVDVGDEKPKTVLSGLVKYVPIEEMKDRVALFLCNLKPVKMRGISSEGMIMCTSDGEKTEILQPPAGCKPGEVVTVEGCERKPDAQLNPKKKIFETLQVDLKTNDKKEATYKGLPWNVAGKGPAVSKSLTNTSIK